MIWFFGGYLLAVGIFSVKAWIETERTLARLDREIAEINADIAVLEQEIARLKRRKQDWTPREDRTLWELPKRTETP